MKIFSAMYSAFFRHISGFNPLSFQMAVAEHVLAGHNLILQASTGAGKTWAAFGLFLYARENKLDFFNLPTTRLLLQKGDVDGDQLYRPPFI